MQGGVLSPAVLFTLYIDSLLNDLKDLGVGCHWDGTYVGVMCYAVDIILLAPDRAVFVLTTTDRQTDYVTPCACSRGNNN